MAPASQRREILNNAPVHPEGRRLTKPLVDYLVRAWEAEDSVLRGVRHSTELAFVFTDVTNDGEPGEDLRMIVDGMGIVLKVEDGLARAVGFFSAGEGGSLTPRSLRSSDVIPVDARFSDVEIRGKRFQILSLP